MKKIRSWRVFVVGTITLYYAVQIGYGMIATMYYVPDIVNSYASENELQTQVSFGIQSGLSGYPLVELLLLVLV